MVDKNQQKKRKYKHIILYAFHLFANLERVYYTTTITRKHFVTHYPAVYILYKLQQVTEYFLHGSMYIYIYHIHLQIVYSLRRVAHQNSRGEFFGKVFLAFFKHLSSHSPFEVYITMSCSQTMFSIYCLLRTPHTLIEILRCEQTDKRTILCCIGKGQKK